MRNTHRRPKFLNLLQIRLPITGIASIFHRITGALLVISLPVVLYLFSHSLQGQTGFEETLEILAHPVLKALLVLFVWALAYHLLAGIRYLLIDLDIGVQLKAARFSAWLVLVAGVLAAIWAIVRWWL